MGLQIKDSIEGLQTYRNVLHILFEKNAGNGELRSGLLHARNSLSRVIASLEKLEDLEKGDK